MSTIEERLAALEAQFEEVKKLKGVPGARGPAGDISAAVANTQREVRDAEGRLATQAAKASAEFATAVAALRNETADSIKSVQAFVDGRIAAAVDGHAIKVLVDYHLLDANTLAPTLHADVTNPTNIK
jgi:hypothetical protein